MTAVAPLLSPMQVGLDIEKARADGWQGLTAEQQKLAIDFATMGLSAKELAKHMGMQTADVKRHLANPLVRAFISDLHAELSKHKIINRAWVEQQIMEIWPKMTGEEEVDIINMKEGVSFKGKKFHSAEIASILKHFSGNEDQKKVGGVQVIINFDQMGVKAKTIDTTGAEDV